MEYSHVMQSVHIHIFLHPGLDLRVLSVQRSAFHGASVTQLLGIGAEISNSRDSEGHSCIEI